MTIDVGLGQLSGKLGIAVLTASLLWGGSSIVNNQSHLATLDERTAEYREDMKSVDERLRHIEQHLAVIAAKSEDEP